MPLQQEDKRSADKKRYRQIRALETNEQRDERNDIRRKKYMAKVLSVKFLLLNFIESFNSNNDLWSFCVNRKL